MLLNAETALATAGTLLRFAFIIAIAVVAYFFWRDIGAARDRALAVTDAGCVLRRPSGCSSSTSAGCCSGIRRAATRSAFVLVAAASVYVGVRTWLDQKRLV